MTSSPGRRLFRGASRVLLVLLALMVSACATAGALRNGERAERERNYDQAVVIYTRALQERPRDPKPPSSPSTAPDCALPRCTTRKGRRLERDARWGGTRWPSTGSRTT